jgi:hypothetical protein
MELFIPDSVKAILMGLIVLAFVFSRLALRFPDVAWLQMFRLPVRHMSEEEKARQRRRANLMVGIQIILAGLVLPFLYLISKVMMFDEPTPLGMIIVAACSVACLGLGIWIIVRSSG